MFILCLSIAIAGAQLLVVTAVSVPPPTAEQRAAYERGRSYERVVLANVDRKWYGIALFRPRFESDLDALDSGKDFPASAGESASLVAPFRSFLKSGDASKLPAGLTEFNAFEPYFSDAPSDGATWWFAEAGMADVAVRAAGDDLAMQLLASAHPLWLTDHASLGGAYGTVLGSSPPRNSTDSVIALQSKVRTEFELAFPERAFVAIGYPKGPMGAARLGVSDATLNELTDIPSLLAQPESQAFVDDVFKRLKARAPNASALGYLADYRRSLVLNPGFDHTAAMSNAQLAIAPVIKSMSKSDQGSFFVGLLAAQAAYNAVAYRDPDAAAQQLAALGHFNDLDSTNPKVRELRARMSSLDAGDWADQVSVGRSLVDEIETDH
jgi:hypothetical protein